MDLVFDRYPWLGVRGGEIITAFCSLMTKQNPLVYSKANIFNTVTKERYFSHVSAIAGLFLDRFNPRKPLSDEEFESECEQIHATIDTDVEDATVSEVLLKMIGIVRHSLKKNIHMHDRCSLGLRLDPKVMASEVVEESRELPYGIIFAHGRRFNAYHVRFRDNSRGTMRLVTPPNTEQHALESAHLYDECYGLAFAQQLKNKDIPEGGSKAVNLINTADLSQSGKNVVRRKNVKAFADTLLDLIVDTEETQKSIVDLFGKNENLYLGPDEQIIPEDINLIG